MKIRLLPVLFGLLAPLAAAESPPVPAPVQPQPLVRVDDFTITNLHFSIFAARKGPGAATSPEQQVRLLNELVNTFMVARSAEGRALEQDPEIRAALDVARAQVLARAVVSKQLDAAQISEADLEAEYERRYGDARQQEYKARHILLDSEAAAREVIEALDKGADFEQLARERSTGPSRTVGGDLGWFTPDSMVKPFADAVIALEDGQYTREPVKTRFGWHVILREQSRPVPAPAFEEVKDELAEAIRTRKLTEYVQALRDRTRVEVVAPERKEDTREQDRGD